MPILSMPYLPWEGPLPFPTVGEGFEKRPVKIGLPMVNLSRFLCKVPTEDWELETVQKTLVVPPQVEVFARAKVIHYESYIIWGGTRLLFVEIESKNWAVLEPPQREDAFRSNENVDGSVTDMVVLETETNGDRYLFLILFGTAEY